MERLGLVEVVSVRCTHLVSVQVLFSLPRRAVPLLAVGSIPTGPLIRAIGNFELGPSLKLLNVVAIAQDWVVVLLWVEERVLHC